MSSPQEQFAELARRTQENFKQLWEQWNQRSTELMKGVGRQPASGLEKSGPDGARALAQGDADLAVAARIGADSPIQRQLPLVHELLLRRADDMPPAWDDRVDAIYRG